MVRVAIECIFIGKASVPGGAHGRARCDDQGPVGARQGRTQRGDGALVLLAILYKTRKIMVKCRVDDGVRQFRTPAQAGGIFQRASMHGGAGVGKALRALIRARHADDFVAWRFSSQLPRASGPCKLRLCWPQTHCGLAAGGGCAAGPYQSHLVHVARAGAWRAALSGGAGEDRGGR